MVLKSSVGWGLVKVGVADQEDVVDCCVPCGGDRIRILVVPFSDEEADSNKVPFLGMKISLIPAEEPKSSGSYGKWNEIDSK